MMPVETNTWTFAVMLEGSEGGIMSFAKAQGENSPFACDQCSSLILYTEGSSQTFQHLLKVRSVFTSCTMEKLRHKAGTEAPRMVQWVVLPNTLWAKQVLSIWNLVCGSAMRALMWRHRYGGTSVSLFICFGNFWCSNSVAKVYLSSCLILPVTCSIITGGAAHVMREKAKPTCRRKVKVWLHLNSQ